MSGDNPLDPLSNTNKPPSNIFLDVDGPDIEDGILKANFNDTHIDDRELINFIEKYSTTTQGFEGYYYQVLQDIFSHPNIVSNVLFVENPMTGQFVPVDTNKASLLANVKSTAAGNTPFKEENDKMENTPLIPKLTEDDIGNPKAKSLLLPPFSLLGARMVKKNDGINNDTNKISDNLESIDDDWTFISMEYRSFSFVKRLVFLVFQGILAGFCFVTIFNEACSNSNESFLYNYSPLSNEVRRFYYLLSSISLIGSVDYLVTQWAQFTTSRHPFADDISEPFSQSLEHYQKIALISGIGISLVYALNFILTILMSIFDVRIHLKDGYIGNDWSTLALNDSSFNDNLASWLTMDKLRAATALLAWFGCCMLLWKDISRFSKLWFYLRKVLIIYERMRLTALTWMKRARALEGQDEIDKMSIAELREIIAANETGLQRSRSALTFLEQENHFIIHNRAK